MLVVTPLLALCAAPAVVALVIPRSSIATSAALPSVTPAPERQTFTWTGDAKPTEYQKRCESDNETCATMTANAESAIAVTTTMLSTVMVPCTTTTTVSDSSTITTTYWSTEVLTQTISVQGEQTITVQIVTPAPQIESSTFLQSETLTLTTDQVATSFFTSYGDAQTVTSTGANVFSTLSVDAGSGVAASSASSSIASVQTASAWTATSASAVQSTLTASTSPSTLASVPALSTFAGGTFATTNSGESTKLTTVSGTVIVSASVSIGTGTAATGTATATPVFSAGESNVARSGSLLVIVLIASGLVAML